MQAEKNTVELNKGSVPVQDFVEVMKFVARHSGQTPDELEVLLGYTIFELTRTGIFRVYQAAFDAMQTPLPHATPVYADLASALTDAGLQGEEARLNPNNLRKLAEELRGHRKRLEE